MVASIESITTTSLRAPLTKPRAAFYYVYVACLLGANAVALMPARAFGETGGNTAFTASWVVLQVVVVLLALTMIKRYPRNLVFVVLFGAYVLSSALWSVAPEATLAYGGMLALNLLAAYAMSSDMDLPMAMSIIGRTILVLCIAGLIAYYVGIQNVYYFDPHGRSNILGGEPFRGFFTHKITAGLYAAVGAVWALSMLTRWRRIAALAVFTWTMALTSSSTGLALVAMGLFTYGLVTYASRRRVSTLSFFLLIAVAGAAAVAAATANLSTVLGALGRDVTLTGRTELWSLGVQTWFQRPFFGWGFAGFFNSDEAITLRQSVASFANYDIPHFHQAYIQTAVDLGVIGFIVLVVILMKNLTRSYRIAIAGATADRPSIAAFTITCVLITASMVMYTFITYNNFATFFVFLLFFMLRNETGAGDLRGGNKR